MHTLSQKHVLGWTGAALRVAQDKGWVVLGNADHLHGAILPQRCSTLLPERVGVRK